MGLNPADFMEEGGGPPTENPALMAAGLTPQASKIDPSIPVTDPGDEFAGDGPDGGMDRAPVEPVELPAGEPPQIPTTPPADSVVPSQTPADDSPPDAMPGEAAFEAWAKADPTGAQRYLDMMQAEQEAASKEEVANANTLDRLNGTSPFADPAEQKLNISVHLQQQDREYATALVAFKADKASIALSEKDLQEELDVRRERGEPTDAPIISTMQRMIDTQKTALQQKTEYLNGWKGTLDTIEAADKMVDQLPQVLGPYREIYVELASQGRFARCTNFEAQKSVLNTELVSRGLPRMGERPTPRRAQQVSPAVQRFRALRSGTAPKLNPGADRTPAPRRTAPAADDGLSKLAPAFQAAIAKMKK